MEILKRPIITEKMTAKEDKFGQFGFIVDKRATKDQIRRAVEELYDVNVVSINTMVYAGKKQSRFTKAGVINGKKPGYKKAIVTLKEGEKIDFYSNI